MHRDAGNGGGGANLCLVLDPGNRAHGLGSASTKGQSKKEGDREETHENWVDPRPNAAQDGTAPQTIAIIKLAYQLVTSLNSATARPL
jgi:hypothetical protein